MKCNEVRLKGAPVTGKQASRSKECTLIKGREEQRPCFGVAFGICGLFAQTQGSTQHYTDLNTKAPETYTYTLISKGAILRF